MPAYEQLMVGAEEAVDPGIVGGIPRGFGQHAAFGGRILRPGATAGVHRAHQADRVAVRILDQRVARAPERVVRRLLTPIARTGQIGVGGIHRFTATPT